MQKLLNKYIGLIILCFLVTSCSGAEQNSTVNSNSSAISSTIGSTVDTSSTDNSSVDINNDNIEDLIYDYLLELIPATINDDLELPLYIEKYGIALTWDTNDPSVITSEGTFIKPTNERNIMLTATFTYQEIVYNIPIFVIALGYSDVERVQTVLDQLELPLFTLDHLSVELPQDYPSLNTYISWALDDENYASISGELLTIKKNTFKEGATFNIHATATYRNTSRTRTMEIKILKEESIAPVTITKIDEYTISWSAEEQADNYLVEFEDIDITYEISDTYFSLREHGVPLNSKYNLQVTPVVKDVPFIGTSSIELGRESDLPKVEIPEFGFTYSTPKEGESLKTYTITWPQVTGATEIQIYCNGILRKVVNSNVGQYQLYQNGIIESRDDTIYEMAIQFVGNYTTHQSSGFHIITPELAGGGALLTAPIVTLNNGILSWPHVGYNTGYQVAFSGFISTFLPASTVAQNLDISTLDLLPGTYKVRVKAFSNNNDTSSRFSDEVTLIVSRDELEAPQLNQVDAQYLLSWDDLGPVAFYNVNIKEANFETKVQTPSFNIFNAALTSGEYTIEVYACLYTEEGVAYTKTASIQYTNNISDNQLSTPTNLRGYYYQVTWRAVEGATGYELEINGEVVKVNTNKYTLPYLMFNYSCRVRALSDDLSECSYYSAIVNFQYTLANIALSSSGTQATATFGGNTINVSTINDGNTGGGYQYNGAVQNTMIFTLDFYIVSTIYQLKLFWENASASTYTIEYSSNNIDWEVLGEYNYPEISAKREDIINLSATFEARYVRINCTKRATAWNYCLFEVQIFGERNR